MFCHQLELCGGAQLTVYLREAAQAMPNAQIRPLVLVVPGGGYNHLSPRESDPVALQFAAAGYHTAILHYSVGEGAKNYQPMRQLDEALRLLRANAVGWNIAPHKIAVCGFSAGGHLAFSSAVLNVPGMEGEQQRPDAVILGYPVITAGPFAHRGSFEFLAGDDPQAQQAFSLEDKVTPQTPPVFVWHTMEDETVPIENTLLLLAALRKAGVPCEAHLFERGAHGTSISTTEVNCASTHRNRWVRLAVEWLNDTFDFHI